MSTEIVAHRGASAERPEHTRAAYELAIEQGADGLECDVRLTRDGHLVCVHDRTVNRTSSGTGVVSTFTLDELRELDFASWHRPSAPAATGSARLSGESPRPVPKAADQPATVLTLAELLGLVSDASRPLTLFVETKHPVRYAGQVESRLITLLDRHGLAHPPDKASSPIVVMSFSARAIRRVRKAAPTLPTVQLWNRPPARYADGSLPSWADLTGPSIAALRADPDYVGRVAERGHQTYTWTVDAAADVQLCQRIGVRYVATNLPAAARSVLGAR